ncbi:MAG: c-type cytochrome [Salinarimonas sp.]
MMHGFPVTLAACAMLIAASMPAAADALQGEVIAERWCASCHLVGPGQDVASDQVASFVQIAQRDDLTAGNLRDFLRSPHPPMPDLQLTHNEIRALIAYIETLE